MHTWDPDRYLGYSDERGRPFVDLVARIEAAEPAQVVDLGCGPGNLTSLLAQRWPRAEVTGIDSSPEMIRTARSGSPSLHFQLADLWTWSEWREQVDVLVANAVLQWIPDHLDLIPRLLDTVRPGGWFAFQVPGNFGEPTHTIREQLAGQAPYADHLAEVAVPASHEPADYWRLLAATGAGVDVWETTYLHVLTGPDPVFTWVSATGARPTLQALPEPLRAEFEREYRARLRQAYPDTGLGVLLPFRRIFVVVHRP